MKVLESFGLPSCIQIFENRLIKRPFIELG